MCTWNDQNQTSACNFNSSFISQSDTESMVQRLTIISSISLNSLWFSFKVVLFWYIFHYALTDLLTLLTWVILYKILTPHMTLKREFSTCLLHVAFVALLSSFGQGTGIVEASPAWNCKLFFVIVLLRLYWNQPQLDKGVFLSNYLLLISLTIWIVVTLFSLWVFWDGTLNLCQC